ncbi:MAG: hypothetical protein ACD_3C00083G0013 [uncultured bacterium (gcode 4)]|uniref:Acetyltransferase n=1 Tax=uncultured bacterium (gcode 4) TaxID=1234023 RepID=K2GDF2_9BACT|nr:MAG: hypothetical protein ACD_3C00083G0013 [uncultured bacterium (gcode 4)]
MKNLAFILYRKLQLFKWFNKIWLRSIIAKWTVIAGKNFIEIWENSTIWRNSSIYVTWNHSGVKFSPLLRIWNNVCLWANTFIACIDEVVIDDNVLTSERIFISDHIHSYDNVNIPVAKQDLAKRWKVLIKSGAFLWINCVIMPWVTIWKNSVIWASAVVYKDVPDYSVAIWNPAKIIKKYNPLTKNWEKYVS